MTLPIRRKRLSALWDPPTIGDIFFDRLLGEWPFRRGEAEEITPSMNFSEKEGNYFLTVEVPGLKKENLEISIEQNVLTFKGKKEEEKEEKGADYYIKEVSHGSFSRSLRLPPDSDTDKVEADLAEGVLKVKIPKKPEAKGRKIAIR